uniref:Uncharacterized protein n=1 Tax=Cacopsylla melanoneura TaxID=428564 RepID=A0A8D8ZSK2_9HEMI
MFTPIFYIVNSLVKLVYVMRKIVFDLHTFSRTRTILHISFFFLLLFQYNFHCFQCIPNTHCRGFSGLAVAAVPFSFFHAVFLGIQSCDVSGYTECDEIDVLVYSKH